MAKKISPLAAGWLLFIFYAVGFAGFLFPQTRELMRSLIWVTLLLTLLVLLAYHKKWNREFALALLLTGLSGYLIEVAGVKTGLIFGHYRYGPTLGFSFWETPLMMTVTWASTLYICRQIAETVAKDPLLVSILASALMVLLDFFIEPFAIANQMWVWNNGVVPVHNYIGWFVCGILLQYMYIRSVKFPLNKLSLPLYLIQLGFFAGLYLLSK